MNVQEKESRLIKALRKYGKLYLTLSSKLNRQAEIGAYLVSESSPEDKRVDFNVFHYLSVLLSNYWPTSFGVPDQEWLQVNYPITHHHVLGKIEKFQDEKYTLLKLFEEFNPVFDNPCLSLVSKANQLNLPFAVAEVNDLQFILLGDSPSNALVLYKPFFVKFLKRLKSHFALVESYVTFHCGEYLFGVIIRVNRMVLLTTDHRRGLTPAHLEYKILDRCSDIQSDLDTLIKNLESL